MLLSASSSGFVSLSLFVILMVQQAHSVLFPTSLPSHPRNHQISLHNIVSYSHNMIEINSRSNYESKSMPPPIRILPATPADAPTMVDVMDSAFEPTSHYQRMYPFGTVPEQDKRQRIEMMQKNMMSDKHIKLFKAVMMDYDDDNADNERGATISSKISENEGNGSELAKKGETEDPSNNAESNRIVGWAQWKMYYAERQQEEWNKDPKKNEDEDIEGMDVGYVNWFFGTMEENRQRLFGGRPYCTLSILVIRPEYQKKGIGSSLLQWGIRAAEEANLPLYLESSVEGYELYLRNGFRRLPELGINPDAFAIADIKDITLMIRLPGGGANGSGKEIELLRGGRNLPPSPPPSV